MIDYKEKYKICGALPSPKDDRDYPINMLIAKAPKLRLYRYIKPARESRIPKTARMELVK